MRGEKAAGVFAGSESFPFQGCLMRIMGSAWSLVFGHFPLVLGLWLPKGWWSTMEKYCERQGVGHSPGTQNHCLILVSQSSSWSLSVMCASRRALLVLHLWPANCIGFRVQFKGLFLTFKATHDMGPDYLNDYLSSITLAHPIRFTRVRSCKYHPIRVFIWWMLGSRPSLL